MNIWLINHYANSPLEAGDARHWSHARELIRRGHSATVVSSNFHHLRHEHMETLPTGEIVHQMVEGVPFVWIPTMGYKSDSLLRVLSFFHFGYQVWRGRWAAKLQAPDVILGSTPHPFAALAAERLASRFRVPFLLELRDPWPYVLTEVGGYSKRHPFVLLVDRCSRYLYRRAARIILFSRDSGPSFAALGGDLGKSVWIPHGVDVRLTPPPRPAPDDGIFTVTYIGAHNQWNSLDAVLDAAKHLQTSGCSDVMFRFLGDGVQKPRLRQRAEQEGIRNVLFDAPVPKNEVEAALNRTDAFILNNRVDNVSKHWMSFNKLYEYLAASRPVVFGSCTRVNPVSESGAGILVEAGNALQMAEAIRTLAAMTPEQRAVYGARGRQFIEANYTIESIVTRFEAMAQEVLEEQLRPGQPRLREKAQSGATLSPR